MTLPSFLSKPDPDWREEREMRRDQYSQRGSEDRPLLLNFGYGEQPWTVEDACEFAETIARRVLA